MAPRLLPVHSLELNILLIVSGSDTKTLVGKPPPQKNMLLRAWRQALIDPMLTRC